MFTEVTTPLPALGRASSVPAFEAVFRDNVRHVWRYVVHLGVPQREAEDLCQEVFMIAHRRLEEGVAPDRVRPWLYGIAWRAASAHRRRAYRKYEVPTAEVDRGASEAPGPPAVVEERRRAERLDRALDTLNENQRIVFVLYEIEQLTMREVAEVVDCSINTAFSRLYAARQRFAEALGIVVPEEVWKR